MLGNGVMEIRSIFKENLVKLYTRLIRLLYGIDPHKVLFISFNGKSYSDNPKAISEKLHEEAPELNIVWAFTDPDKKKGIVPDYVRRICSHRSLMYYKELSTCAVAINNFPFPLIDKGEDQMFIQTFHGDRAPKKVMYDSPFKKRNYKLAESIPGFCNLGIVGSEYGEKLFRSGFRYTGEILKTGTPRCDMLVNPDYEYADRVRNTLGIADDTKVLMYAPTYRRQNVGNNTPQEIQKIDLERTIEALENKYDCKWVCLIRTHPGARQRLNGYSCNEGILDVTQYEDMADLLLISDMLVTDYSSSAGDYAILRRPLVLFQSDIDEYIEKDRSFYFDMNESPFLIAKTQQELEELISTFDDGMIKKNCKDILSFFHTNETGCSSQLVVERIIDFIEHGK